ncbi:MAG: hypothetical protein EOM05_03535 [Clostridia bacterium]|nr:hypothetical protein [Clostridia bacterium]
MEELENNFFKKNGGEIPMITTAFLTGIADVWFSQDVTRIINYGFSFNTQTLSEIMNNLLSAIF